MRLRNSLNKLALVPALAVALLAGACADQSAPMGQLAGPEQASFARGGARKLSRLDVANTAAMSVTRQVGSSPEVLQAGNYFLSIPGGAVRKNTTFTMHVDTDGLVTLTAFRTRWDGTREDVGVRGFHKPLTLALYYGNAAEAIANPASLQVAWVQSNGSLAPVISSVDVTKKLVLGKLQHFSGYAIAMDD